MTTHVVWRLRSWVAALCVALAPVPATASDVYALIIGIDAYQHINRLKGAVNDALDIMDATARLEPMETVLLLDSRATRANVLDAWTRLIDDAAPGDTVVVTYAGHGGSEIAAYPETEDDGRDETLLLAGYAPEGQAAGERIRDDEIGELISRRSDVTVIVLIDACHSGTTTRAASADLTYRFFEAGQIVDDPLPPPPPPPASAKSRTELGIGRNVYFGAVRDHELAPEIGIGGQIRGALSYAFADGIRGAADHNLDGAITKGELETHIRRTVKNLLSGRQKPQVDPPGDVERVLFASSDGESATSAFTAGFEDLPPVPVRIIGGTDRAFQVADLVGAVPFDGLNERGLVVDLDRKMIVTSLGDVVRHFTKEVGANWRAQTQGTINKMRMVFALLDGGINNDLDVSFPFGDDLYFDFDEVNVAITGRRERFVIVFNLPPDGTIQWLYPRYPPFDRSGQFFDPQEIDPDRPLEFDGEVTPPFGAEHVVTIETPTLNRAALRAVMRHSELDTIPEMWEQLHFALKDQPHRAAVHAYFTAEEM